MELNQHALRQINDVQIQANKLLHGNPSDESLVQFSVFNEELKHYLKQHLFDSECQKLLLEIPIILDVDDSLIKRSKNWLLILGLFTLGISALYINYISNLRKQKMIQNNIQIAKGKYSSIDFMLKLNLESDCRN